MSNRKQSDIHTSTGEKQMIRTKTWRWSGDSVRPSPVHLRFCSKRSTLSRSKNRYPSTADIVRGGSLVRTVCYPPTSIRSFPFRFINTESFSRAVDTRNSSWCFLIREKTKPSLTWRDQDPNSATQQTDDRRHEKKSCKNSQTKKMPETKRTSKDSQQT
jgi:hypothetical protein